MIIHKLNLIFYCNFFFYLFFCLASLFSDKTIDIKDILIDTLYKIAFKHIMIKQGHQFYLVNFSVIIVTSKHFNIRIGQHLLKIFNFT